MALELEVTPNQQRFLAMKDLGTSRNTVPVIYVIEGGLDIPILRESLQRIVDRHDSLRTVFRRSGSLRYRRVVLDSVRVQLRRFRRVKDVGAFVERRFRRRFDGSHAPLFDFFIVEEERRRFRLCCLFDHSVFDGVSASVFGRELGMCYNALAVGEEPIFPGPSGASDMPDEDLEAAVEECLPYWRKRLEGRTSCPEIFTEAPRPREMTHEGGHCFLELPGRLVSEVKGLAVAEGTTVFTAIAAALNILVFKNTRKEYVNIGVVSSGRRRSGRDASIGCFINNAVLTSDISSDMTCRALIRGVRDGMRELIAHEDVPFDRLVRELRIPIDRSRNPLFQILLNWYPQAALPEMGGLRIDAAIPLQESHFDMTLYGFRSEGKVLLNLNYKKGLFTEGRSMEFLRQLQVALERMVENPDGRIGEIGLLSEEFRRMLPDLAVPMPDQYEGSVIDSVERSIELFAKRVALADESGEWTYSEFGRAVQSLSESMRGLRNVAVLTGRNALLPICVVSALRSGATLEILDPEYPPVRLRDILDTVEPDLVLATEATRATLEAAGGRFPRRFLPVSKEAFFAASPPREFQAGGRSATDGDAYVLFTSGSTGRPKAILNTLRPLSQFIDWYIAKFSFSPNDRFSMISGLSHDPLLRDILTPLACGAELAIPRNESISRPSELLEWVRKNGITVMHLTPAHIRILLMNEDFGSKASRLRRLFVGGDKLGGDLAREVRARAPRIKVTNFYGATETPQAMAFYEVGPECPDNVPIGKGRDGCDVLIMEEGRLCGMGEVGEIVIRSPYLSKGYLGDPDGTASKFIQNPLSRGEDLLYLTGDTGRLLADGSAECIGRKDDQVKLNGVRIELGEIDAALRRHPDVASCATLLKECDCGIRIVSYYELRGGSGPAGPAMKEYLERYLPGSMIPSELVRVGAFPLTPNGKVDKGKLLSLEAPPSAPTGEDDVDVSFIRGIFPFVRRNQAVRGSDTFNTLGGDSLSFIQSSMLLERYLGHLPKDWENTPIRELKEGKARVRERPSLDITELIRAVSIVLIVLGHAKLLPADAFNGNVAILFMIAGFSFARFKGASLAGGKWLGSLFSYLSNILIPYWIVVIAYQLYLGRVNIPDLLLYTNIVGEDHSTAVFYVFFIQVLTQSLILLSSVFSLKGMQRLAKERMWILSTLMLAVAFAFFIAGHFLGASERTPNYYLWMMLLGWAAFHADGARKKLILSGSIMIMIALIYSAFGELAHGPRNACLLAGLIVWVRNVPCPLLIKQGIQYLAASTYIIYLTHIAVFNVIWAAFDRNMPWVFSIAAIAAAVAYRILIDKIRLFLNGRRALGYAPPSFEAYLRSLKVPPRRAGNGPRLSPAKRGTAAPSERPSDPSRAMRTRP